MRYSKGFGVFVLMVGLLSLAHGSLAEAGEIPTCRLNAEAISLAPGTGTSRYKVTWSTENAKKVTLVGGDPRVTKEESSGEVVLEVQAYHSADSVSLSASANNGFCSTTIDLTPKRALTKPGTCELDANVAGDGFDLTWKTDGASSAEVGDFWLMFGKKENKYSAKTGSGVGPWEGSYHRKGLPEGEAFQLLAQNPDKSSFCRVWVVAPSMLPSPVAVDTCGLKVNSSSGPFSFHLNWWLTKTLGGSTKVTVTRGTEILSEALNGVLSLAFPTVETTYTLTQRTPYSFVDSKWEEVCTKEVKVPGQTWTIAPLVDAVITHGIVGDTGADRPMPAGERLEEAPSQGFDSAQDAEERNIEEKEEAGEPKPVFQRVWDFLF